MKPNAIRAKLLKEPGTLTPTVEVKTVTWIKDSHGLFDYENSNYKMSKFTVNCPSIFFRNLDEIKMLSHDEFRGDHTDNSEPLLSLTQDRAVSDKFLIEVSPSILPTRAPLNYYLIVRSLKCSDGKSQRGFGLAAGQVVKLGRVEYRVLETCTKPGGAPESVNYNVYR